MAKEPTTDETANSASTVIKKYANRRLYNTGTSTYVTLEDLAIMVKRGEEFHVVDARSGDDITHSVLTQIIFEQENKGQNLLPINVLRQLIRFYGDSMQGVLPSYLEHSIDTFVREQDALRNQFVDAFGPKSFETMQEVTKRNMEMFRNAMTMFSPFPVPGSEDGKAKPVQKAGMESAPKATAGGEDLDTLRRQILDMQSRLDKLDGK
ncbi:MAG: polyhydroxyalkanoate synthesis repressor PhaR [Hyphomicrobiaceae bacterium]|nr:polyhydroxyalkanoate synthesis repressor PhaR [Hyphomicrobiaceae bacterium]